MNIHILMHESCESPGAIATWAELRGHKVHYTKPYEGDQVPTNADAFDMLIIMGGPQSPATTQKECSYFDANAEMHLIRDAVAKNKYVWGACLGAQLIGQALGGQYAHSPHKEIGSFPVQLTEVGRQDPLLADFPDRFMVGHWHADMPGLTPEAEILATSEGCPRQIVRYGTKVYGFQCHFEFTRQAMQDMIMHSQKELACCRDLPFVQSAEQMLAQDYTEMNQLLFKFFDRLAQ